MCVLYTEDDSCGRGQTGSYRTHSNLVKACGARSPKMNPAANQNIGQIVAGRESALLIPAGQRYSSSSCDSQSNAALAAGAGGGRSSPQGADRGDSGYGSPIDVWGDSESDRDGYQQTGGAGMADGLGDDGEVGSADDGDFSPSTKGLFERTGAFSREGEVLSACSAANSREVEEIFREEGLGDLPAVRRSESTGPVSAGGLGHGLAFGSAQEEGKFRELQSVQEPLVQNSHNLDTRPPTGGAGPVGAPTLWQQTIPRSTARPTAGTVGSTRQGPSPSPSPSFPTFAAAGYQTGNRVASPSTGRVAPAAVSSAGAGVGAVAGPTPSTPDRTTSSSVGGSPSQPYRAEKPSYHLWKLDSLKDEAIRLAGKNKRGVLQYGPVMAEESLSSLSSQHRPELVHALETRAKLCAGLGRPPEWTSTPVGITPEKRKQKEREERDRQSESKSPAPKKAKKLMRGQVVVSSKQAYHCQLACLTFTPGLFQLYLRSRGGAGGVGRDEADAGALGANHEFYVRVAKAMVDEEYKDSDGNGISLPDDHIADDRAPHSLKSQLASLDLVAPARGLREQQREEYPENDAVFMRWLQRKCYDWIKDIKAKHTYRAKETQSGGAGADETEDGGHEDSIHSWNFMMGRIPTLIWQDGMETMAGGDDNFTGDVIIPDGAPGSGSSVPGGPGVRATQAKPRPSNAGASTTSSKKKKKKPDFVTTEMLRARTGALLDKISSQLDEGNQESDADREEELDARAFELITKQMQQQELLAKCTDPSVRAHLTDMVERTEARREGVRAEVAKIKEAREEAARKKSRPRPSSGAATAPVHATPAATTTASATSTTAASADGGVTPPPEVLASDAAEG